MIGPEYITTACGCEIRTYMIDGKPWFYGRDICAISEVTDSTRPWRAIPNDMKQSIPISDGANGYHPVMMLSLDGVTEYFFRSSSPTARAYVWKAVERALLEDGFSGSLNENPDIRFGMHRPKKVSWRDKLKKWMK